MTITQAGILALIKAAVTNEKQPLPDGFDMEEAYSEISRHNIIPLCYAGGVICGIKKEYPAMQRMFTIYLKHMMFSEKQMAAVSQVCTAFEKAGIDYMPFKGSTLKALYPKPEFRLMGDADILIRREQYPQVKDVMQDLEFTYKGANEHEYTWTSDALYLELHTHLIPSVIRDYHEYYEDSWRLAAQIDGHRYAFRSPEDELVYLFAHYAKHFLTGGIGCRHVLDLWVFRKAHPDMDEEYIRRAMARLKLTDFYANTLRLLDMWFAGAQSDPRSEFISEFIFTSGNWGDAKSHALASAAMEAYNRDADFNRHRSLVSKAFPGMNIMGVRYPVVKKHPALMPLFWPVRIAEAVLFRRKNIKRLWNAHQYSTGDRVQSFQEALDYMGLHSNGES